jgi:hypothetical protein
VADGEAGLQVIDVSNPADPQRVGGYDTSGEARGVAVSGNYAYVAARSGVHAPMGDAGLQVIDVSNPADPQRVGGYDTEGAWACGGLGQLRLRGGWDSGLQVIDVSDPANPQRVGGYATSEPARAWPSRATTPTWRLGLPACRSLT